MAKNGVQDNINPPLIDTFIHDGPTNDNYIYSGMSTSLKDASSFAKEMLVKLGENMRVNDLRSLSEEQIMDLKNLPTDEQPSTCS